MSRYVYIGGFGNGKANAERVGSALDMLGATDVDTFTFAHAINNPDEITKVVESAFVITHSAGFMALKGTRPVLIDAFAAPLPTSRRHLVAKTVTKTIGMHLPNEGVGAGSVLAYDLDATRELIQHPVANLSQLGKIAKYNAIGEAIAAEHSGIEVRLWYGERDSYFSPTQAQIEHAGRNLVPVSIIPGIHDQLVLEPATQLQHLLVAEL